jgi:hypothetical protein
MRNKTKMLVALMVYFLSLGSYVFASFPVKTVDSNNKTTFKTLTNTNTSVTDIHSINKSEKKLSKPTISAPPVADDGDLLITLLLWFFLWPLAAHRWYRQKPVGWNILFILTFGGCGIWALVDLINIIVGNF